MKENADILVRKWDCPGKPYQVMRTDGSYNNGAVWLADEQDVIGYLRNLADNVRFPRKDLYVKFECVYLPDRMLIKEGLRDLPFCFDHEKGFDYKHLERLTEENTDIRKTYLSRKSRKSKRLQNEIEMLELEHKALTKAASVIKKEIEKRKRRFYSI